MKHKNLIEFYAGEEALEISPAALEQIDAQYSANAALAASTKSPFALLELFNPNFSLFNADYAEVIEQLSAAIKQLNTLLSLPENVDLSALLADTGPRLSKLIAFASGVASREGEALKAEQKIIKSFMNKDVEGFSNIQEAFRQIIANKLKISVDELDMVHALSAKDAAAAIISKELDKDAELAKALATSADEEAQAAQDRLEAKVDAQGALMEFKYATIQTGADYLATKATKQEEKQNYLETARAAKQKLADTHTQFIEQKALKISKAKEAYKQHMQAIAQAKQKMLEAKAKGAGWEEIKALKMQALEQMREAKQAYNEERSHKDKMITNVNKVIISHASKDAGNGFDHLVNTLKPHVSPELANAFKPVGQFSVLVLKDLDLNKPIKFPLVKSGAMIVNSIKNGDYHITATGPSDETSPQDIQVISSITLQKGYNLIYQANDEEAKMVASMIDANANAGFAGATYELDGEHGNKYIINAGSANAGDASVVKIVSSGISTVLKVTDGTHELTTNTFVASTDEATSPSISAPSSAYSFSTIDVNKGERSIHFNTVKAGASGHINKDGLIIDAYNPSEIAGSIFSYPSMISLEKGFGNIVLGASDEEAIKVAQLIDEDAKLGFKGATYILSGDHGSQYAINAGDAGVGDVQVVKILASHIPTTVSMSDGEHSLITSVVDVSHLL